MEVTNNINAIISTCGVIIGVMIGFFGNILLERIRDNRNDKKDLKSLLFNLMQILNRLEVLNKNSIIGNLVAEEFKNNQYFDKFRLLPKKFQKHIIKNIKKTVLFKHSKLSQDLTSTFNDSILSLSRIDPKLAYDLTGLEEIENFLFDLAKPMKKQLEYDLKNNKEITYNVFKNFISVEITRKYVEILESSIFGIAKKIGYSQLRAIKKHFKHQWKLDVNELCKNEAKNIIKIFKRIEKTIDKELKIEDAEGRDETI